MHVWCSNKVPIRSLFLRYCYYTILEGEDTARFVRNLAKSKNGHWHNGQSRQNGQDGKNGQNGQKIGQNGHRTGLARLPDYYLNI